METPNAFPVMDEMPDCECCEPAEPWARPNHGFVIVVNVLTGKKVRACGSCLQSGIPLELVVGEPERGPRPPVGEMMRAGTSMNSADMLIR